MIDAVNEGALTIEKLEAMTCVCSVGLDMIAVPGDTSAATIAGIIADEAAIGRAFDAMCEAPAARFADWREHALALSRDEFSREKTIRNMTNLLVH